MALPALTEKQKVKTGTSAGFGERLRSLAAQLRPQAPAGERQLIAILVTVSLVAYALAARMRLLQRVLSGDEPAYLVLSQAMQRYHSLDVARVYANGDYHSFFDGVLAPHLVEGAGGHMQTLHQFGGPLLWLIPFSIAGRAGALAFMVVVSVLCVVNIYYFLRERGIEARYAFVVGLVLALGSPIYVLASMSFVEPIGTLIMIFVVRAVLMERLTRARIVVASIGVAIVPWVHMRFAPVAVSLGLLLLWRVWRDHGRGSVRPYVPALAPLVLSAVLLEVFTIAFYGEINPMAPQRIYGVSVFDVPLHEGFTGTLFDRNYGLVTAYPIFLLVLPGILLAARRSHQRTNAVLAAVIVPAMVLACTSTTWWGSYNPAGRYPSIIVPLLSFYVAVVLQQIDRWYTTCAAILLGIGAYALHLTTDIFAAERFTEWDLRNRGMERLGDLIGISFVRRAPSSFLPGQTGLFAGWIVATAVIGVALWLVGRRRWTGPAPAEAVSVSSAPRATTSRVRLPEWALTPTGGWVAAGLAVVLAAVIPLANWPGPNPTMRPGEIVDTWQGTDGGRLVLRADGTFTVTGLPHNVLVSVQGGVADRGVEPRWSGSGHWRVGPSGGVVELGFGILDGESGDATAPLRPAVEGPDRVLYLSVRDAKSHLRYVFLRTGP